MARRLNRSFSMLKTVFFFMLFLNGGVIAAFSDDKTNSPLEKAIEAIVAQEYRKADELFESILRKNPDNADALYLRLANHQTRILDYESYALEAESFIALCDSVEKALWRIIDTKRGNDSLWCVFYIGSAQGGKSVMLAKSGKWLAAARDALSSVAIFNSITKKDSTFYPAFLGTGIFKYYLSQSLKWLLLLGGNRAEEGIREIERATQAVPPYDLAAKNSLCWIFIERGEFQRAELLVKSILDSMPDNTIFLRIHANIAYNRKEWKELSRVAEKMIELSEDRSPVNWSDLVLGYEYLIHYYDYLKKRRKVLYLSRKALNLSIPDTSRQIVYVKEHLKRIEEMRLRYVQDDEDDEERDEE
ncbi:MAG: hypothetical protein GF350_03105 [Chitinivibrionales bacterium]|nr:hypothetical protein [Chitinivibrionales bacterium]